MEALYVWVVRIAAVVAFIVLIEIVMPSGKLKKVVDLILGFILMIFVLDPMIGLFKGKTDMGMLLRSAEYDMHRIDIGNDARILEEVQKRQVIYVYKSKVIGNIIESVSAYAGIEQRRVSADISVDEDTESVDFGMIRHIYIELNLAADNSDEAYSSEKGCDPDDSYAENKDADGLAGNNDSGKHFKPININPVTIGATNGNSTSYDTTAGDVVEADESMVRDIKDRLSALYGIERGNITITVR